MRWTVEPNVDHPKWPYNVLVTDGNESLESALVEFWKRILTDGSALAPSARTELAIEILPKTFDKDDPGFSQAIFYTSVNTQCEGLGSYLLRHGDFTCIQSEEEDDDAFERKQLVWQLDQYAELKKALKDRAAWPIFKKIRASGPLGIRVATSNGWIDFRADQEGLGPLPENDQLLLAGKETIPDDLLQDLACGVLDIPWRGLWRSSPLLSSNTRRLLQEHSLQDHGRHGTGQSEHLFYDIQCPEFPDEGTTEPGNRLHAAATCMVQHLTAERGAFRSDQTDTAVDESWLHSGRIPQERFLSGSHRRLLGTAGPRAGQRGIRQCLNAVVHVERRSGRWFISEMLATPR
jgi:hypothetical protein